MKKRAIALFALLLVLLVCADLYLSNTDRIALRGKEPVTLDLSSATKRGSAYTVSDGIRVGKGGSLVFSDLSVPVSTVAVEGISDSLQMEQLTLSTMDDGNKMNYRTYVDDRLYTDEPTYFSIRSAGNLRKLRIECKGGDPFTLTSVTLNAKPPLRFHFVRVALVFGAAVLLFVLWKKRLFSAIFDKKKPSHLCAVMLSVLLSLLVVACCCGGAGLKEMPLREPSPNAYEQLFTSLLQGKVSLDVDFDASVLEGCEDPYDYTERNTVVDDVFGTFWDRAYYNGNFYCYFGIAPIFVCYFPVYLLTFGTYIPNATLATMLVLIGAVLGFYGLLLALLRFFRVCVPVPILCLAVPTLTFASLLPMIGTSADMYYLPIASALCFLSLALNFGFRAVLCDQPRRRTTLFVLSGVCSVLTAASRPTIALYLALLIPPFVSVLTERGKTARSKVFAAVSYLTPVLLGACGILYYNFIRFDSVLEFGTSYQLTLSDVSYNRLRPDLLAETFAQYFLQFPAVSGLFPFLTPSHLGLNTYGTYFYSAGTVGAFCFPVTWAFLGAGTLTRKKPCKRAVYLLALLLPFGVAFLDTCVGGVNIRYLSDVLFPLALLGILILCEAAGKLAESKIFSDGTAYRLSLLLALPMLLSLVMGFALIFANERSWIAAGNPYIFRLFERLFTF